ncbi:retron Eco8 family effector endonuclease [Peribacillus butanolivorans]|uniref:retron Eco8 family effector endonuclease n=1 Tax=Peribacillus butanolivorans TaxID=421767 RepID=UPI0036DDD955
MGIVKVEFENAKNLSDVYLNLDSLNVLVGINGTGKSHIQKFIKYFYDNLTHEHIKSDIFDKENPYNDYVKISIKYNLSNLLEVGENQRDKIFNDIIDLIDDSDNIKLTMIQYKNNVIKWNCTYEQRKLIQYLFPFYLIDVRNIDLFDWENIWNIIGDLGQKRSSEEDKFPQELEDLIKKIYGKKYIESISELEKELENIGYGTVAYRNNEKFKQINKIRFNGENFNYKNRNLDFYSTGSNSFNYLRIFYLVLSKLHKEKLKEPLVILDEPEIGLHPTYIDELIKYIANCGGKIQTILSTHSSRVLKNSIVQDEVNIFQVSNKKNYTIVKKVKSFKDVKEKKVITDRESSYYFSQGILFVEGITEFELFTNNYLKEFYPILNDIEIFAYDSNNIALDVSHPRQRKMNIPYLLLLDMDKILNYNEKTNKFNVKGDAYNPLKNEDIKEKEWYFYGEYRVMLKVRNLVRGIANKIEFLPTSNDFSIQDKMYDKLVIYLKYYCNLYNVYPVTTTIEGTLVNLKNYSIFLEWILSDYSNYPEKEKLKNVYEKSTSAYYRLDILKHVVEGKTQFLSSLSAENINKYIDKKVQEGYLNVRELPKLGKSSGWVTDFIEYYFANSKTTKNKNHFQQSFPELDDILKVLEIIMK